MALPSTYPAAQGLYNPANEHDACGVAMVATLNKVATHEIVAQALTALRNLEHRGAAGAEPGDTQVRGRRNESARENALSVVG